MRPTLSNPRALGRAPNQVEHRRARRRALSPTLTRWNIVDVLWFGIMLTAGILRVLYFLNPLRLGFSIFKLDYQVGA